MLNGLLFPEDPADTNIMGGARFLVVNDPHHALQTEYLQRSMPYFFRLHKNEKYVPFVFSLCSCKQSDSCNPSPNTHTTTQDRQHGVLRVRRRCICASCSPRSRYGSGYWFHRVIATDQRLTKSPLTHPLLDRKDKDPLSNRDLLLHDIINVGRDGVGGAMAKRHGCMYRIDVLKQGKDVRGQTVLPEEDAKKFLGKGVGFSTLTVRNCANNRLVPKVHASHPCP